MRVSQPGIFWYLAALIVSVAFLFAPCLSASPPHPWGNCVQDSTFGNDGTYTIGCDTYFDFTVAVPPYGPFYEIGTAEGDGACGFSYYTCDCSSNTVQTVYATYEMDPPQPLGPDTNGGYDWEVNFNAVGYYWIAAQCSSNSACPTNQEPPNPAPEIDGGADGEIYSASC